MLTDLISQTFCDTISKCQNGKTKHNNDKSFRCLKDILQLFKDITYYRNRNYFRIKNNVYLWCPKLTYDNNKNENNKRVNTISVDENKIYESCLDFCQDNIKTDEMRIIFAKCDDKNTKNTYKFTGVFLLDKKSIKNGDYTKRVWKKVS